MTRTANQIIPAAQFQAMYARPARLEIGYVRAIDPGNTHSAYCLYSTDEGRPLVWDKLPNEALLANLATPAVPLDETVLVIEQIASYGMAVGEDIFETVFWSGRFAQMWEMAGGRWERLKRQPIKLHLCKSPRANDANIRQALIDRYGPTKELAIGKKASPGPLYGMSGDCWAALAVAVTYADTRVVSRPLPAGEEK